MALGVAAALAVASTGAAASPQLVRCRGGDAAATAAGLTRVMDRSPSLRFLGPRPSREMYLAQSLCGDLDGDGRRDRAVLYDTRGGTGRSPSVAAVLLRRGPGHAIAWRNVGRRLFGFHVERPTRGIALLAPNYAPGDATCCYSGLDVVRFSLRDGRLVVRRTLYDLVGDGVDPARFFRRL